MYGALPYGNFVLHDHAQNRQKFEYLCERINNNDTNFFATEAKTHNKGYFCHLDITYDPQYAKFASTDLRSFPQYQTIEPQHLAQDQLNHLHANQKKLSKNPKLVSACTPCTVCEFIDNIFLLKLLYSASVVKIHSIVSFTQYPFMSKYVDALASMRAKTPSDVHKKSIKALTNSLGKRLFHWLARPLVHPLVRQSLHQSIRSSDQSQISRLTQLMIKTFFYAETFLSHFSAGRFHIRRQDFLSTRVVTSKASFERAIIEENFFDYVPVGKNAAILLLDGKPYINTNLPSISSRIYSSSKGVMWRSKMYITANFSMISQSQSRLLLTGILFKSSVELQRDCSL